MIIPRPEVAERLHELRFKRFLILSRSIPKVKGECAWCGGPSRMKYCSGACTDEAYIRSGGDSVTRRVFGRDHGVCAECGLDTSSLDLMRVYLSLNHFRVCTGDGVRWMRQWNYPQWVQDQWGPWWPGRGELQLWQADHIIPVVEGGGCCGIENYQTLCLRCHKEDTARLARRLAGKRDEAKNGPLLLDV